MLTQVKLADCAGKTIKAAGETYVLDPAFVIVFTDGTFCQIVSGICYDSPEIDDSGKLKASDTNQDHVAMGVISGEERAAAIVADQELLRRQSEARERREFERLRAQFGQ